MHKGHPVVLAVSQSGGSFHALSKAMNSEWQGEERVILPQGMSVQENSASAFIVTVDRTAFVLEFDAVVILTLKPLKISPPFLVPPDRVLSLQLKCTTQSFEIFAICSDTSTVSLKEAKRLSHKKFLPPGIHHEAALRVTGRVQVVQGGLPSLGKRK